MRHLTLVVCSVVLALVGCRSANYAFWEKFGPALGNLVPWIQANKGPESTDAADQILIDTLGQRTAAAASNGSLSSLDVAGLSTAGMIGLAKLIGTTKGGDYQGQNGQDFLAFTSQNYIEQESNVDAWDRQNFDGALNTMLSVTGQNDGAARTLFAGSNGQELVKSENLAPALRSETAICLGELYRHSTGWKFKVIGQGYDNVRNLADGMFGWVAAGRPLVSEDGNGPVVL